MAASDVCVSDLLFDATRWPIYFCVWPSNKVVQICDRLSLAVPKLRLGETVVMSTLMAQAHASRSLIAMACH
jgi:hypothetical protein